jgi:hypothetical protein
MMPLPQAVTTLTDADAMLDSIVRFTQADLPFVAQVAQFAREAGTLVERERALVSLYRLGLEHQAPYVTDLTDELLCWIERAIQTAA